MSEVKVKSGSGETATSVSVQYDIPTSVAGLVDKYGEEQVVSIFTRGITLAVQALVRQKVAAGAAADSLQAAVDSWVPGVRGPATKKTPFERAQSALSTLSMEELEALRQEIASRKKAK